MSDRLVFVREWRALQCFCVRRKWNPFFQTFFDVFIYCESLCFHRKPSECVAVRALSFTSLKMIDRGWKSSVWLAPSSNFQKIAGRLKEWYRFQVWDETKFGGWNQIFISVACALRIADRQYPFFPPLTSVWFKQGYKSVSLWHPLIYCSWGWHCTKSEECKRH